MIKSIIFLKKNIAINKRISFKFQEQKYLFLFLYDKCSEI